MNRLRNILEYYSRAMDKASSVVPDYNPLMAKREIADVAKESLGIREDWIPVVKTELIKNEKISGIGINFLRTEFWDGFYGAAHLYVPESVNESGIPFVLLCPGHGEGCKMNPIYQMAAMEIASRGMAVLVPDTVGAGEREFQGHRHVVAPFECGMSVQGLIVMEYLSWLRWASKHFDNKRMGACGNSGGGTATCFLAALAPELAALASSGYPSSFRFIAMKEKTHCHCNILPHILGSIEMWQLYGSFAPKPLFIFQGMEDSLIPQDLCRALINRVADVYEESGKKHFKSQIFSGSHPWDKERIKAQADFFSEAFNTETTTGIMEGDWLLKEGCCWDVFPENAIDIGTLCMSLSGKDHSKKNLWEVFSPSADISCCPDEFKQIFAQFEAFLK